MLKINFIPVISFYSLFSFFFDLLVVNSFSTTFTKDRVVVIKVQLAAFIFVKDDSVLSK